MSADLPKPSRREKAAAGALADRPIRPLRILSRALLAAFLRTGGPTFMFRLFSQGTVVFLSILRKDAVPLSIRP